jgi:hypothetical protein
MAAAVLINTQNSSEVCHMQPDYEHIERVEGFHCHRGRDNEHPFSVLVNWVPHRALLVVVLPNHPDVVSMQVRLMTGS